MRSLTVAVGVVIAVAVCSKFSWETPVHFHDPRSHLPVHGDGRLPFQLVPVTPAPLQYAHQPKAASPLTISSPSPHLPDLRETELQDSVRSFDSSAEVVGCSDRSRKKPGNNCRDLYDGVLYSRSSLQRGPYAAFLQPVKEGTHAASLIELPSGALLMAWFSGTEGEAGVVVAVSSLPRDARQWTMPRVVSSAPQRSNQNPVLFHDAERDVVVLMHTSQEAGRGQGTSRVVWLTSRDSGASWTPPAAHPSFPLEDGPFLKGKILIGGPNAVGNSSEVSTEWLLPMYYTPTSGGLASHYCAMWRSDDHGATWKNESLMSWKGQFLAQPTVVRLHDGSLRAFFRDRKGAWIYWSDSTDDGRTWPEKHRRSKLPNNQSGIQAILLASGNLLMAFNNMKCGHDRCHRHPVSLALSEDEGLTWSHVRDIEFGGSHDDVMPLRTPPRYQRYSYPTLIQTRDQLIHVAFSYRKKAIKHVVVDEEWIKYGGTIGIFKGSKDHAQNVHHHELTTKHYDHHHHHEPFVIKHHERTHPTS
ncbi:hypothetical protein CYMTET_21091 [Cymbomonas tetramitiformis]|uniref:Sialidase domain-containing protein n=1 Tax=Cymbomonas tetramitiformis TaxID=36881 RepID=A0AAE0G425_9CHLO|nr:hypothetical protein CYMTET_21091 [Cymbomonas tetramitiformis]